MPGSQGEGTQPGTVPQPTWDPSQGGGQAGGEETWETGLPGVSGGDWETSNQLPGGQTSNIPPMPSERGLPPGQGQAGGASPGQSGDRELDKALEDFDGEILAERSVIQTRSNERAGSAGTPSDLPPSGDPSGEPATGDPGSANQQTASYEPRGMPSQNRPQRTAPAAGSSLPDDIPDARDDDIIARQLREAAMNEADPELREKLWEEYRRYKGA